MEEFIFEPTESFTWFKEFPNGERKKMGEYHTGNTYNCTRFPIHGDLREKTKEWKAKGMIKIYPLSVGKKFVMTTMEVPVGEIKKPWFKRMVGK